MPRMSQTAHHLENGSASASENGVDRLAAADAAKTEANAHFKGVFIMNSASLPCDHRNWEHQDASCCAFCSLRSVW